MSHPHPHIAPARPATFRLRPAARRHPSDAGAPAPVLQLGPLAIDAAGRRVQLDGVPVPLTAAEFDLLLHLARRRGQAVTRDELLRVVLDHGDATSRTVDTHVSAIRRKLGDDAAVPRFIHTVRGYGYRVDG